MVYIILGKGFEEIEAVAPCDILRRAEAEVTLVSVSGHPVMGAHGIAVGADCMVEEVRLAKEDTVVLPGGWGGVKSVEGNETAMRLLAEAWELGCTVAAICAGPTALAKLHITDGKKATCYPGLEDLMGDACMQKGEAVVRDGRLITGEAPGAAIAFGLALLEHIKGSEAAHAVADGMVLR